MTRGFDLYHMAGWHPEALRNLRRADRAGVATREVGTTARMRGLTDRIVELFGLSLFEMDIVHRDWYVIDVNPVVSLHGVENGAVIYERLIRSRLSES